MWHNRRATRTASTGGHGGSRRAGQGVFLLIAALALLPMFLTGCDTGTAGNLTLAKDQTFNWTYQDIGAKNPSVKDIMFDPALIATLYDENVSQMIYTNLVTFDSNLHVVGDAAKSWTVTGNGTIYTFHLRPNMKFSDGTPLTAADFAYGINRSLNSNICTADDLNSYGPSGTKTCSTPTYGASTYLNHILGASTVTNDTSLTGTGSDASKSLEVVDPLTLTIQLDKPISYFLDTLTYPTSDAMEKSFVTNSKWAGGQWVNNLDQGGCSGPFMVKSYGQGNALTLVPNPYWSSAFGKQLTLTSVVITPVSSDDAEYAAYRAETPGYDYTDVPANIYGQAYGQPDFHEIAAMTTEYIGVNTTLAPFNSLDVRRAFDLALNKQILVDHIEDGGAIPTNHIIPQGMPGYNTSLTNPPPDGSEVITGNQAAAVQLIKKAQSQCPTQAQVAQEQQYGQPNNEPDFCPYIMGPSPKQITFYVPNDTTHIALGQAAAQQWNSVLGVNVNVAPSSLVTIYTTATYGQSAYQLWMIGWIADYPDPQDWLSNLFESNKVYNGMNLNDSAINSLLDKADVNQNATQRLTQYEQAEQMAVNDVAWIPFQQDKLLWRIKPTIHGFGFNALGVMQDIAWPNVYIDAN